MTETFVNWRKSTRSGGANQCVDCAVAADRWAVRDSKAPASHVIISAEAWRAFLNSVKHDL